MRKVKWGQSEKEGARKETYHGSSSHLLGRGRLTADRASKPFSRGVLLLVINDE
jgi:hypothetical protein